MCSVGYIRIDNPVPKEHPSNESCPIQAPIRRIGRCDLGTKLTPPWPCTLKDAQDVFTFDEEDPGCMDICAPPVCCHTTMTHAHLHACSSLSSFRDRSALVNSDAWFS